MEAIVETTGGPLQVLSSISFQLVGPPFSASTIFWQLAPPPPTPQQYTLFQTGRAEIHTGISAQAGDVLRMTYDSGPPPFAHYVSWFINGVHQHTFENVDRRSTCHQRNRWLPAFSTSSLESISLWVEP
jgi:hypothetical protein